MARRVFVLTHKEYEFLDKEQLRKKYQALQTQKLLHIELVSELF